MHAAVSAAKLGFDKCAVSHGNGCSSVNFEICNDIVQSCASKGLHLIWKTSARLMSFFDRKICRTQGLRMSSKPDGVTLGARRLRG